MRVAFVTVGDTRRLTGGYLYNARVIAELKGGGIEVEEVVASGASPEKQEAAAPRLDLDVGRFEVIVVDALASIVCAPHLDRWREMRPVVAMVHELPSVATGDDGKRGFEEPLLRADLLVAVSEHGGSILRSRGVPSERIRIISPGLDRLQSPEGVAGPSARDDGPLRGLCVAQWIPRKGILDLVRAWTARERPGSTLELVGETDVDPDYAASVRRALAEAPDASITVSGPVDDAALAGAYAAADLFALPSHYEGYGLVYAEALAYGLPILACRVGPVPELVGEEAALLVPPGDPPALCKALDLLLGDADLRRRMSAAALCQARKLPRWSDAADRFRRVLREALEERRAGVSLPEDAGVGPEYLREQNRRSWNAVVGAHDSHRGDLAGFLRSGGITLFPEERGLLGDLGGKKLVHLLCNSGGDSLSLALLGADVTGVDISDAAISSARALSAKSGIPALFERADVYDWLAQARRGGRRFDVAFSSYGAVCWLSDLEAWARDIAAILEPGGRFVLVDFHPASGMFDEDWNHAYGYYFGGEPLAFDEGVGDYVAEAAGALTPAGFIEGVRGFANPERCHLFLWGLGEVVTALAGAGLRITALEEYPYSNGERHFAGMRELPGRRMVPPEGVPALPLMYGIRAAKG